jgi:hypothetical protein
MKRYIIFIMAFLLVIAPNKAGAVIEGYDIVAKSTKENITLYAKKMNGLYYNFEQRLWYWCFNRRSLCLLKQIIIDLARCLLITPLAIVLKNVKTRLTPTEAKNKYWRQALCCRHKSSRYQA